MVKEITRNKCKNIVVCILLGLLQCGCQRSTPSYSLVNSPIETLPITLGSYNSVAWLSNDMLVFSYKETPGFAWEYRLVSFDSVNNQSQEITLPNEDNCRTVAPRYLSRLPTGELGLIVECGSYKEGTTNRRRALYGWDIEQNSVPDLIFQYEERFDARYYSFASDMSEWLQTVDSTGGLDSSLYHVESLGQLTKIFPEFARVRAGSYSPNGRLMAFMGVTAESVESLSPFNLGAELQAELDIPWTLYIADADGENSRETLSGVVYGDRVKWSPNGRYLSFIGRISKNDGIWMFDLDENRLFRVWEESALYDWSPDGCSIVVLNSVDRDNVQVDEPTIVSPQFLCS